MVSGTTWPEGLDVNVSVPLVASGAPGAPGAGLAKTPFYTVPPAFAGLSMIKQAIFLDPAAPQGVSSTGGLHLVYGVP